MELPATTTVLFGRDDELAQISEYLHKTDCRLITLVGPGGIGKTRLSIEAARRHEEQTGNTAAFVDLQAVDSPELVITAVAEALAVAVGDREMAVAQVAQYLSGKETLLLLDNFEQVVESADSIGELIEQAPSTKLLVTSRTPLRLTQEWLFHVNGLPVPQANRPRQAIGVASIELFADRARRMRPDFQVDDELEAIERICQVTEGMPLALELAASWTRMLSCAEIAAEIEHNRQFLTTDLRDVPERHRSMQAVFDQVLRLLEEEERRVFSRLSVFRGGFSRDAAEQIAGATLPVLSALVDNSLVHRVQGDRYRIHELVRQLAQDQLAQSETELAETRLSHARFYTNFVANCAIDINTNRQDEAVRTLEPDLENLRAAWIYASAEVLDDAIAKATQPLAAFLQHQGRFLLGGELFQTAVDSFKHVERHIDGTGLMVDLLVWHGWFSLRQGHIDTAEAAFQECLEIQRKLGRKPPPGFATDPELGLAYVASTRGEMDAAKAHARSTLERGIEQKHIHHVIMTNQLLGHLALRNGELDLAADHARTSLKGSNQIGDRWFSTYCHDILGEIAVIRDQQDEAIRHFEVGLKIRESFRDKAGIGVAHSYLGELSMLSGAYRKARYHFEAAAEAHSQVGDRGSVARARAGTGLLDVVDGNTPSACDVLDEVLETAAQMQFLGLILDALSGIGQLALKNDLQAEGAHLLGFVSTHESTEPRTHSQLQRLLDEDATAFSPHDGDEDIDEYVELARKLISRIRIAAPQQSSIVSGDSIPANGSLLEALTEREVEVLSLIAAGHSNQQIADDLILSLGTIKWHSNQIYMKLGVRNRTSAVAKANELGLISVTG